MRPVRSYNIISAGTLNKIIAAQMPTIDGPVTVPTPAQTETATRYLTDNWAKAIG